MAREKPSIMHEGKTVYLSNKELLPAVIESKERGKMSDKLAKMLMLLCSRYAKKGNFVNYSYNDDMQSYAMMMLVRTWASFNPAKSDNPFAFFTQCVKHSFIQYLNHERRQRDVRDAMLVQQGMNPSFAFEVEFDTHVVDDEENFEHIRAAASVLSQIDTTDGPIERDERGLEVKPTIPDAVEELLPTEAATEPTQQTEDN